MIHFPVVAGRNKKNYYLNKPVNRHLSRNSYLWGFL
jgi:hypothetical protein